jgi:hypothetical protein
MKGVTDEIEQEREGRKALLDKNSELREEI